MPIKLYYDLMSQPSRAMYILLKTVKCEFEPCYVDIRKGPITPPYFTTKNLNNPIRRQHVSEEYTKLYRMQLVPLLDYNGFILGESIAMIRYLSAMDVIPDSLYPRNPEAAARVDEFLEWHHLCLRLQCALFFRSAVLEPKLSNTAPDPKRVAGYQSRMMQSLEYVDQKWLGRGHKYITGDTITVADLWAACEVEQPRMAGFDPSAHFNNIATWIRAVRAHFGRHYEDGHVIVNKIVKKLEPVAKL